MSDLASLRADYEAARAAIEGAPTADQLAKLEELAVQIATARLAAIEDALTEETEEVAEVVEEPQLVTASAATPAQAPEAPARATFRSASDVPGHATGSDMDFGHVAEAVTRKMKSLRGPAAARHEYQIASLPKAFDSRAVVRDFDDRSAIDFARNEANLKGGSLVASGGWCTPSETWYDLIDYMSTDGLLSLPEVMLARGGVRLIPGGGAQFEEIFAATGFCFTEAQDIAGDYDPDSPGSQGKPCYKVDCPEWTDYRLEVCGLCITAGILQNSAFPELTEDTIRKALKAHAHRIDSNIIADVVAGSTAVAAGGLGGAAAPLLNAIELQALDIRSQFRMSDNATIEVKLPSWTKGLVRADVAYTNRTNMLGVSDAEMMAWFSDRNVSVQFLANFEPLYTGTPATAYASTVPFLIYPAGAWVKGATDVIDLGVVHDAASLAFNNYTALFTEEGYVTLPVGQGSRAVEVPVCADGTVGALNIDCAAS